MMMNEVKHTPGPWKCGVRRDGSMWLSLGDPMTGPHYQGDLCASVADARLIAAAPDMLAALKEARAFVSSAADLDEHAWGVRDPDYARLLDKIDAALAAAEGRP
jgi:hypothetical protein